MNELTAKGEFSQPQISSLLSRAKRDPAHTLTEADLVLGDGNRAASTSEERAIAAWIRGVALFEMGRNHEAVDALTDVVRTETGFLGDRAAVSLAAAEAAGGDGPAAVKRLKHLMTRPDPIVQALASSQLGLVHLHRGELRQSLALLDDALPVLRADAAQQQALARTLINIGTCHLLGGEMHAAKGPLEEAIEIANQTGQTLVLAGGLQNLGCVEARLGNTDDAIERLEHARRIYHEMGDATRRNLATLFEDLSETYRFAGLAREALRYARLSAWAVRDGDNIEKQTDADYQRALCLLAVGNRDAAVSLAERTRAAYLDADRPLRARRVDGLILDATAVGTPMSHEAAERAEEAALELAGEGWTVEARAMRIRLAELLAADDQRDRALACLAQISRAKADAPLLEWLDHCYAAGLALHLRGERADTHMTRAQSRLRTLRSEVVDPELRLSAARMSDRFRALGLAQAVVQNDARAALMNEEQWRALGGMWLRPARATSTEELGDPATNARSSWSIGALDHHLDGSTVLMQWAVTGEDLYRIVISSRASTLARCGPYEDIVLSADNIRQSMARLLRPGLTPAASAILSQGITDQCDALGSALGIEAGSRDLVVVPTGQLAELPWRLIARADAVRLIPNAQSLDRSSHRVDCQSASLLVGPRLEYTDADVRAFIAAFPEGTVIQGDASTIVELGELMQQSSFLHVAAHGRFRSDSPRHSSLELADGVAMLHQLEELTDIPTVVVLGVCEAARGQIFSGGLRRGATSALLDAGTECIVAPICAVPDRELGQVLAAFYQSLPGQTPHDALAQVAGPSPGEDPLFWATAHATQCVGTDEVLLAAGTP